MGAAGKGTGGLRSRRKRGHQHLSTLLGVGARYLSLFIASSCIIVIVDLAALSYRVPSCLFSSLFAIAGVLLPIAAVFGHATACHLWTLLSHCTLAAHARVVAVLIVSHHGNAIEAFVLSPGPLSRMGMRYVTLHMEHSIQCQISHGFVGEYHHAQGSPHRCKEPSL